MVADKAVLDEESDELRIELQLDGIGVSLIDEEPRELLHASLQQLKVVAVRTPQQHSLNLTLAHLQVTSRAPLNHSSFLEPLRGRYLTVTSSLHERYLAVISAFLGPGLLIPQSACHGSFAFDRAPPRSPPLVAPWPSSSVT